MHYGLGFAGKALTAAAALIAIILLVAPPKSGWSPPLMWYVIFIVMTMPFAVNRGSTYNPIKAMIAFYVLTLATLGWVKDARTARPIVLLVFIGQFLWWGVFGVMHGAVKWHTNLANYDGYGPLMTMGIGLTIYFGMAARSRTTRNWAFLAAIFCVAGVVGSFARGAVLGAIAVVAYVWLRWPRKGQATLALLAAAIVVVITASFLSNVARGGDPDSPKGFFQDFMTITNELDRDSGGSSNERRMLWSTAVIIFKQSPIIGAGAGNFGPAAAALPLEDFAGWPIDNPARLWDKALHSSVYQVLCEGGLVGCFLYLWMLYEFVRRNRALRASRAQRQWQMVSGGELDLRYLSWGLEAGMLGFLTTSLFYNQIYVHWLYTMFIVNALLYKLSRPPIDRRQVPARRA